MLIKVKIYDIMLLSIVNTEKLIWKGEIPFYMLPKQGDRIDLNGYENVKFLWHGIYEVKSLTYCHDLIKIALEPFNVPFDNANYFREPIKQESKSDIRAIKRTFKNICGKLLGSC